MTNRVYLFRILDEDAATDTYSCVANSGSDAEENVLAQGFIDFYLLEVRDLDESELPGYAENSIKINPFVGKEWEPVTRALVWVLGKSRWTVQTFGRYYDADPDRSPCVKGRRSDDGSLHVYFRGELCVFEPGWTKRFVAERIIETWTSQMNINTADWFSFSEKRRDCDQIEKLGGLDRSTAHFLHFFNPNGAIFQIVSAENDRIAAGVFSFNVLRDPESQNWVEIAPRILCPLDAFRELDYSTMCHVDSLSTFFGSNEIFQDDCSSERLLVERSPRQMREVWNIARERALENTQGRGVDIISAIPPRIELDEESRGKVAHAHRVAFLLYGHSRCRLGFLLIDRAENVLRLLKNLGVRAQIPPKDLDLLCAAAWLSMLTQPAPLISYHRRVEPIDLLAWGVDGEVIDLLLATNPTVFKFRKDWFRALEENSLARYLAAAIELDRIVLSEMPRNEIPKRLFDLGKQSDDLEPPRGVTPFLRIAQTLMDLATDTVTSEWIDETLSNPRIFWKDWDEFLARTRVNLEYKSEFQLANVVPFFPLDIPNLFSSAGTVRSFPLFDNGALNLGLAVACRVGLKYLHASVSPSRTLDTAEIDGGQGNADLVREIFVLGERALAAAEELGYPFLYNENHSSLEDLNWMMASGEFGVELLAQKIRSVNHRDDYGSVNHFEMADLFGQIGEDVLLAVMAYNAVREQWRLRPKLPLRSAPGRIERVTAQADHYFALTPVSVFSYRAFSDGIRPSYIWANSDHTPFAYGLAQVGFARERERGRGGDGWGDDFNFMVFALTVRNKAKSQQESQLLHASLVSPNLVHAARLASAAVFHAAFHDNRPASIMIACTGPGRIEQTVEIEAQYRRGVLLLAITVCGETLRFSELTLELNEGATWDFTTEPDPMSPNMVIQRVIVEINETVDSHTPCADSLFRQLRLFLSNWEAAILQSDLGWDSREIHSMILRQSPGGFVAPVLQFYGRNFPRGVTVLEPLPGQEINARPTP